MAAKVHYAPNGYEEGAVCPRATYYSSKSPNPDDVTCKACRKHIEARGIVARPDQQPWGA